MKINNDVANVLAESKVVDSKLYLPEGQLDRKLYMAVDKVLKAIGGKWNRKEKAHIFAEPPEDKIDNILLTGEYTDSKKVFQFYETPEELAQQIVDLADIIDGESVLEPSAGKGRIAQLVPVPCDCVELEPGNRRHLLWNGFRLVGDDFLKFNDRYDVIVANPPFTRQQDIDHILHMMKLAKRRVVSVASASVMFRENRKTVEFREKIEALGGTIEELPQKTFAKSGTNVNTCLVVVDV